MEFYSLSCKEVVLFDFYLLCEGLVSLDVAKDRTIITGILR